MEKAKALHELEKQKLNEEHRQVKENLLKIQEDLQLKIAERDKEIRNLSK
jgi:hypothetical protein